jgi:hypothetical protein
MIYFFGAVSILVPLTIFFIYTQEPATVIPYPVDETNIRAWDNIEFTFRLFMFVLLIVVGTSLATSILKRHKINYVYIFDINLRFQVTPIQMLSLGVIMLFVWQLCLMC